jgi:hypothetical protein
MTVSAPEKWHPTVNSFPCLRGAAESKLEQSPTYMNMQSKTVTSLGMLNKVNVPDTNKRRY